MKKGVEVALVKKVTKQGIEMLHVTTMMFSQ